MATGETSPLPPKPPVWKLPTRLSFVPASQVATYFVVRMDTHDGNYVPTYDRLSDAKMWLGGVRHKVFALDLAGKWHLIGVDGRW